MRIENLRSRNETVALDAAHMRGGGGGGGGGSSCGRSGGGGGGSGESDAETAVLFFALIPPSVSS